MYQLFYTKTMSPVQTGDVVHFSGKAWTVEEVCNAKEYLSCWAWVRSMDEQHLTIRVTGSEFDARFIQTRAAKCDAYRVTTSDDKAYIHDLKSGEAMQCDKAHYNKAIADGMSVGTYFKTYF